MQPTDYVDTCFGIDGGGNCLCGPYMPLGLVRPGPDTTVPQATSGYRTGDPLLHFSQNHVSGTGGGGRYGNIGILPYSGKRRRHLEPRAIENEDAAVGRYGCTLLPGGERVDLTCAHGAILYDVGYPDGNDARLRIDLGAVIKVEDPPAEWLGRSVGTSVGGFVDIVSDCEVIGRADLQGGWGTDHPYSVYFYLKLDHAIEEYRILLPAGPVASRYAAGSSLQVDLGLGAIAGLRIEVGLSYVSVGRARQRVERELAGQSFDAVLEVQRAAWEQVLSRVNVTDGREEDQRLLYSSLYRLYCMPTDRGVDDELDRWTSGVRHFSEFYCIWDSVRNANSLFGLLDPDLHRDMLNCLLDIADHIGWIPDAWIASRIAHAQGGSGADILFAEAALKGLEGVDYAKALRYMRKNAEVDAPEPERSGRIGRAEYEAQGYLRDGTKNCVSRSVEYANQDLAIALLARHLGDVDTADRYGEQCQRVWELWKESKRAVCPRTKDDVWLEPFDPTVPTRPDFWNCPYFYEGTAVDWTLNMRQDIRGLIERLGGSHEFEAYLDRYFAGQIHLWKEINLHTPYLYHYVGKPGKSCRTARALLRKHYRVSRDGLPDNEDMGCQSAYVICTMLGLYPEMGRDFYYLVPPLFERVTLQVWGGRALEVLAPGASEEKVFIRKAALNGTPLERAFVRHGEIAGGGTLELEVTDAPTAFGAEPPPNGLDYL